MIFGDAESEDIENDAGLLIKYLESCSRIGSVRLLMLEFLTWRDWQQSLLAIATGVSLAAGLAFVLNVF